MIATVCSKWAARLPSAVTTVHLSSRVRVAGLPAVIIGSIASVIPSSRRGPRVAARRSSAPAAPRGTGSRSRDPPAPAPRRIPPLRPPSAPRARCRRRDCRAAPGRCPRPGDSCVTSQQALGLGRDLSDRQRRGRVGVQPVELHAHVHAHDAALRQHPPGGRNAVHDLVVDRGAEGLGEAVQSLERRHGARDGSG